MLAVHMLVGDDLHLVATEHFHAHNTPPRPNTPAAGAGKAQTPLNMLKHMQYDCGACFPAFWLPDVT